MKALKLIANALKHIFYPEGLTCAVCECELDESGRYGLCPGCSVPFITNYCKICGTALAESGREYCDRCVRGENNFAFEFARAPYPYERESVHKLVWNLKYGMQPYCAKIMAQPMAEFLSRLDIKADALTFVPLHPKKERKRSYNQSELLAKHISEISGIPVTDTLKKNVYSKSSATKLGKSERESLLENTFSVTADVRGKRLILIDDVFTTGATANECAKTLKAAKAKAVYVLTYATSRGDKPVTYDPDEDYLKKLKRMRVGR